MADLTITAASVVAGTSRTENGVFGATVTQGQVVYRDASDGNKYKLADADSATAGVRVPVGIALNAGSNNQPATILLGGDITIGATLVAGTAYYLSPVAGGICPLADIAVGDDYVLLGLAESTTVLHVDIQVSGATRAS